MAEAMNRRNFLAAFIAATIDLALYGRVLGASDIALVGTSSQQAEGRSALDFLERVGWFRFVQLNIAEVRFDYQGVHGGSIDPNTHGSRATVHFQPNYTAGQLASMLVHEAAHQMLANRGFGYTSKEERKWNEWGASLVQQVFNEAAGIPWDAYRKPEDLP